MAASCASICCCAAACRLRERKRRNAAAATAPMRATTPIAIPAIAPLLMDELAVAAETSVDVGVAELAADCVPLVALCAVPDVVALVVAEVEVEVELVTIAPTMLVPSAQVVGSPAVET